MIAHFLFFALIGGISSRYSFTAVGLVIVLILAAVFGVFWLPLDLVEFGFGYLVGRAIREKSEMNTTH